MKKTDDKERKLTKAEQKRVEKFEITKQELFSEGYEMKEHTLGIVYANVMAFVVAFPIMLPMLCLYYLLNYKKWILPDSPDTVLFIVSLMVFVVIHEAVHGISWSFFTKNGLKSIEFGIMPEMLTPYCTCSEPLKKGQYIFGSLMPLFIVGIIPAAVASFIGCEWLFGSGLIMILGAGGDIIVSHRMVRYKSDKNEVVVYDHPTKCGFITFER